MGEVAGGAPLSRREVVARLLDSRGDLLVVAGLGSPAWDVMAAGDHERNYYLWAAMGSAAMVGLGLARAQPQVPVLVVTGDGEAMMGLGGLATVAVAAPRNLTVVVLDNGHFGETGMQRSHTGLGIELARVAAAMGMAECDVVNDLARIDAVRETLREMSGPRLFTVKVAAENPPRVLPPRDGVHVKNRLRAALGHAPI